MCYLLGAITVLVFVLLMQGHPTELERDIYKMKRVCHASYKVRNGALERQCGELIDRVQQQGFKVINDNGNFLVEVKHDEPGCSDQVFINDKGEEVWCE